VDVQFKGSVADIETAFHVTMGLYHDPIENRDFYAPDREPSVDLHFRYGTSRVWTTIRSRVPHSSIDYRVRGPKPLQAPVLNSPSAAAT
jgi:hypothetical protein